MGPFKRTLLLVSLAAMVFAFAVQPASATSFTLSMGNPGIAGYAGPYGTVNVVLVNSTTATITFTALSAGGYNFLFGDGGSVGLNVNATNFSASSPITPPTGPQQGARPPIISLGGAGNEDGWGSFNFRLTNRDGFRNAFRTVTFTLTNVSGTWASDAAVLTPNSLGHSVAAHIFVANANWTNTNNTGFATNANRVPDGGMTISLLGLGLAGLGLVARRKQ